MNRPIVAPRAFYYKNVCLAVSQMAQMYITPGGVTVTTKCANNLRLLRKQRRYGVPVYQIKISPIFMRIYLKYIYEIPRFEISDSPLARRCRRDRSFREKMPPPPPPLIAAAPSEIMH